MAESPSVFDVIHTEASTVSNGPMTYADMIQHIRFTMADIAVQDRWDNFSFTRLLNRISFLIQRPICFQLCHLERPGLLTLDRSTVLDPLYVDKYEISLQSLDLDPSTRTIPLSSVKQFIISIFSTNFYVIIFEVKSLGNPMYKLQHISYEPVKRTDNIARVFIDVFQPFGPILSSFGLSNHLNLSMRRLLRSNIYHPARSDRPSAIPFAESTAQQIESAERKVEKILEDEIDLIGRSPLIARTQGRPMGLLVTRKIFSRRDIRFGHYFYDVRVFLSSQQKRDIRISLRQGRRPEWTPFPIKDCDEWFWQQPFAREPATLWRLLDQPLSGRTRLFAEYTLTSGASILNIDPFQRGDVGWYAPPSTPRSRQATKEYMQEMGRLVALHYILQMMAPDSYHQSLLTIPIRVSGSSWLAVSAVVRGPTHASEFLVGSEEFERRFLLYHSLLRDFENRVRRRARAAYVECVANIFNSYVRQRYGESGTVTRPASDVQIALNERDFVNMMADVTAICRVFPFSPIHFGPPGFTGRYSEYESAQRAIGDACEVEFGIAKLNPFFDRLQLRPFLTPDDVHRQLANQICGELGRYQADRLRIVSV